MYVQAWGGGGGGGGGSLPRTNAGGGSGGGGGFTWCLVKVTPLAEYGVDVGEGGDNGSAGPGGAAGPGTAGTAGTVTTVARSSGNTVLLSATGGAGTSTPGVVGTPGLGGDGTCSTGGVNLPGNLDSSGGEPVDGIVGTPVNAGGGGDGGIGGPPSFGGSPGTDGEDGGDGYVVVYWYRLAGARPRRPDGLRAPGTQGHALPARGGGIVVGVEAEHVEEDLQLLGVLRMGGRRAAGRPALGETGRSRYGQDVNRVGIVHVPIRPLPLVRGSCMCSTCRDAPVRSSPEPCRHSCWAGSSRCRSP
ncbi:hypothetical protein J7E99_27400 [Streptomyces sp. ISL-44]|uniref:hypothetical protein n=1 Tax=Streptomyces sp. ISL-44 TaxID=2819184 RepID=UPI001BECD19F|nr:hypothetical protein [Streptomyces sp. ISL-44]MBT2544328.1 hypothetical protein [Streptomyces sp. ISL-44]